MASERRSDPFDLPAPELPEAPRFDFLGPDEDELETERMPPNNLKMTRRAAKIRTLTALKRKFALEHIGTLPEDNESVHIVTNARFDLWDWVPTLIRMVGRPALEFYGSTWILNRRNATELLELYDQRQIHRIGFLTGIYFKRRESATYATLSEGLLARGQLFKAALNHSKWFTLLFEPDDQGNQPALTLESSANFTENGNIETHVLTRSRELFEFHRGWCLEILTARGTDRRDVKPAKPRRQ